MIALPTDLEITELLVPVQAAVLEATRTVRSPRRSTRFRVTRNAIIAGAAIAALTAGSLIVARLTQADIDHSAICFEHASTDSTQFPISGAGATTDEALDPLAGCAYTWQEGYFDPAGPADPPDTGDFPVPQLVACTLPDGSAGVFHLEDHPVQNFCGALGLADWDSD